MKEMHGIDVDPDGDIVICCGQSEAFTATMFASMIGVLSFLDLARFPFSDSKLTFRVLGLFWFQLLIKETRLYCSIRCTKHTTLVLSLLEEFR